MAATVTAQGGNTTLASASGKGSGDAGATFEVDVPFTTALPVGQYTMHFASTAPPGFSKDVDFSVAPPGLHPPHGTLLGLLHAPYAPTGDPARIDGSFRNDGTTLIASARLTVEVRQGDRLLANLESDALAVPRGAQVNLTVYWTPPAAGSYTLHGQVVYDGYLSHTADSILNAAGSPVVARGGLWWLWLLLIVAVIAFIAWLRSRRKKDKPKAPKAAPRTASNEAIKMALRPRGQASPAAAPPSDEPPAEPVAPPEPPAAVEPSVKEPRKAAARPAKAPAKKAKPAKKPSAKAAKPAKKAAGKATKKRPPH